MEELRQRILRRCEAHFDDIVAVRRDIHMHPELGLDVQRTADIAAGELERLGINIQRGIGKTGVVGDIEVPGAERRIALRADMDALPMQELSGHPYRSRIEGRGHMCGHDVHTAMLIGAARILVDLREELAAHVRLVFQPSEEKWPGGAPGMIRDGVLEGVDEMYALHVWPVFETGQFGICPGAYLGQADHFEIEINGVGGHAAMPSFAIDPIVTAAQFVTTLQSIVSRNVDPLESAVVSVTQFHAGTADNVIPPDATLVGTVRTLKREVQRTVRDRMERLISGLTSGQGATCSFYYGEGYPVTINHDACVERALSVARALAGHDQVIFPQPPTLGSEDFGYYSQKIPSCFINLGCGNRAKGITGMVHDPRFDVDETCMVHGMALEALLALTFHQEQVCS